MAGTRGHVVTCSLVVLAVTACVGDTAPEEAPIPATSASTSKGPTSPPATEAGPASRVAEAGSVRSVIAERPDLSEANRVVDAWLAESEGRAGVLRNARGVTIFLPRDDAFDDALVAELVEDPTRVSDFLGDHFLVGTIESADLGREVVVASGATYAVEEGPMIGGREIVQADLTATNGVVHVLDGPLTPETG